MPQKENKVVALISTLSKAEKRNFTIFATRNQKKDLLFLDLFTIYEKYGNVNDQFLLKKISKLKQTQIKNIRSHLYIQLLTSLRLMHQKSNDDIAIRQQIDFARVLYNKGLYIQSLKLLNKVKKLAVEQNRSILALEILFFEKAIESQNITKSLRTRSTDLIQQSSFLLEKLDAVMGHSNLNIELYAYYLNSGFCFTNEDLKEVETQFKNAIVEDDNQTVNFYASLYLYQSRCWYFYIRQEFDFFLESATKWVQLFHDNQEMIAQRPNLYMKGLHHVISGAFFIQNFSVFKKYSQLLSEFSLQSFSYNEQGNKILYEKIHELDAHFFQGNFDEYDGEQELLELLEQNPYYWDAHRLSIFYYKLGCIAFGQQKYNEAIPYLLNVGQYYRPISESKVFLFSKILLAFCHSELKNYQLVDSMVNALQKGLRNSTLSVQLELNLVQMIVELNRTEEALKKDILIKYLAAFNRLKQQPLMEINFLHFYVLEWIEAKLRNISAQTIIAEAFHKKQSTFVA